MNTSEQINELAAALASAQAKFPTIKNDSTAKIQTTKGGEYSYSYATLAATLEKVREHLAANGLAVSQFPETVDGAMILTTRLFHKSGQWLETVMSLAANTGDIKAVGSAITYARRYAIMAVLGLATDDDDDDGDSAGKVQPKSKPAPTATAQPQPGWNGQDRQDWCVLHDCQMSRHEKDGKSWFSHKLADGAWCNGSQPKGNTWSADEEKRKRFFARLKAEVDKRGLSIGYELIRNNALHVEHLADFSGSEDDAVAEAIKYLDAQAELLGA